ncbi:acyl-CoA dehydrogenase [Streptomyces sp. KL2]|uniref:acyl-CoA dehydrogenase n=1 Tax=Streptomyces sp. KL2 TaxID=3050126 RepID=UPI003977F9B9
MPPITPTTPPSAGPAPGPAALSAPGGTVDGTEHGTRAGRAALATDFWPRVARELADDLAADVLARERACGPPLDEVSRLRESGLLGLLAPPGPRGRGADWQWACALVREIAAVDSSVGELLGRHYALSWAARLVAGPERAAGLERRAAERQWLWAGDIGAPGAGADAGCALTPVGGGYVLSGHRALAAGVAVAERLVLDAVCTVTDTSLVVVVDPAHPGVVSDTVCDRLGQRLAGAGGVRFHEVPVDADHVLGPGPRDEHVARASAALAPAALRLALAHVELAVAEGALAEARDVSRRNASAWASAGAERGYGPAEGEADLLLAYGKLAAAAHTAAAVVERATRALARELRAVGDADVPHDADTAVLVATAEAVTGRTALHVTGRVLELADSPGLDRFWRNARVLAAQSPTAPRLRDIGDHYLHGARTPSTV